MRQSYYIHLVDEETETQVIKSLDLGCTVFDPQSWVSVPGCLLPVCLLVQDAILPSSLG